MRYALAFLAGATVTAPIAGAVAFTARTEASREITERHVALDAEYRAVCAQAAVAGVAWMRLAEARAEGLTGGRVWVTTLRTEEGT